MKQLFDESLFQMFAERATMVMTCGGAEYGECAATAARIASGDVDSWYREWFATADRVESLGAGHVVSAREAFLRASTYCRISFYPLFGAPVDPRLVAAWPTFVGCAEGDPISAGAERLYGTLTCPKTLVRFPSAEGADGHCEGWNRGYRPRAARYSEDGQMNAIRLHARGGPEAFATTDRDDRPVESRLDPRGGEDRHAVRKGRDV